MSFEKVSKETHREWGGRWPRCVNEQLLLPVTRAHALQRLEPTSGLSPEVGGKGGGTGVFVYQLPSVTG